MAPGFAANMCAGSGLWRGRPISGLSRSRTPRGRSLSPAWTRCAWRRLRLGPISPGSTYRDDGTRRRPCSGRRCSRTGSLPASRTASPRNRDRASYRGSPCTCCSAPCTCPCTARAPRRAPPSSRCCGFGPRAFPGGRRSSCALPPRRPPWARGQSSSRSTLSCPLCSGHALSRACRRR